VSASKRFRLTAPGGIVEYVYAPRGGWPRDCQAKRAWRCAKSVELCPLGSEPVTIQDGRAAPGAP
jgi:hypothetical protein